MNIYGYLLLALIPLQFAGNWLVKRHYNRQRPRPILGVVREREGNLEVDLIRERILREKQAIENMKIDEKIFRGQGLVGLIVAILYLPLMVGLLMK